MFLPPAPTFRFFFDETGKSEVTELAQGLLGFQRVTTGRRFKKTTGDDDPVTTQSPAHSWPLPGRLNGETIVLPGMFLCPLGV